MASWSVVKGVLVICSASAVQMWWNVGITQSLGWAPANHCSGEWVILILLRGLMVP